MVSASASASAFAAVGSATAGGPSADGVGFVVGRSMMNGLSKASRLASASSEKFCCCR